MLFGPGDHRSRAPATWSSLPPRPGSRWNRRPGSLQRGVKVIDLAADFRLKNVAAWEKWYGMTHACPNLLEEAVYGLPELNRARIQRARVVGNPGCYATAVQLGFLPLVEAGVVDAGHLIADAKSGVSGAGRKAEVHILFSEAADNFKAYNVSGHRHSSEILEGLGQAGRQEVGLTFVPHLTPMIRGIHATLYARLTQDVDVQQLYEKRYRKRALRGCDAAGQHPGYALRAWRKSVPDRVAPSG